MTDSGLAVVGTYAAEIEADLARTVLQAEGIECMIRTDDCRGLYPNLAWQGVQLLVRLEDAPRAARILADGEPPTGAPGA